MLGSTKPSRDPQIALVNSHDRVMRHEILEENFPCFVLLLLRFFGVLKRGKKYDGLFHQKSCLSEGRSHVFCFRSRSCISSQTICRPLKLKWMQ